MRQKNCEVKKETTNVVPAYYSDDGIRRAAISAGLSQESRSGCFNTDDGIRRAAIKEKNHEKER